MEKLHSIKHRRDILGLINNHKVSGIMLGQCLALPDECAGIRQYSGPLRGVGKIIGEGWIGYQTSDQ